MNFQCLFSFTDVCSIMIKRCLRDDRGGVIMSQKKVDAYKEEKANRKKEPLKCERQKIAE